MSAETTSYNEADGGADMEEKIFSMLEKMYIEIQEMKMATKVELQDIKESMATKHDLVKIEGKMDANFKALFDGYNQTYEKLEVLEKKVDRIEKKVDSHDIKIKVISCEQLKQGHLGEINRGQLFWQLKSTSQVEVLARCFLCFSFENYV